MPTDGSHDGGQITGCSGGATIGPDGTPTLMWCHTEKAVPRNRNDPLLRFWNTSQPNVTEGAGTYLPRDVAFFQDVSVWRESSGRYRLTYGSSFCKRDCPKVKAVKEGGG